MQLSKIIKMPPDENGMIELIFNGDPKKFIKKKLVDYMQRHPEIKTFKIPKEKKLKPVRITKRKPVIAIKDGIKKRFVSSAAAARALQICRTNIPHALSGKYSHTEGYQFKYAN